MPNNFKSLAVDEETFDKFSAYCETTGMKKYKMIKIILDDFLKDKLITKHVE